MPQKYELLIDQIYARTEEAITEKEALSFVEDGPSDILLDGSKLGYKAVYFCSPFHHKQFTFFAQERIPSFCKFSQPFEKGPISIPSINEDLFFTFE